MKDTKSAFITVTTYADFLRYVDAFAKGKLPLLLIIGDPGVSKSQSIKAALSSRKDPPAWLEGQLSPIAMYCALFRNRDKLIVIDDVDSLYANDATRRLLKCVCQTDYEKSVSWNTKSHVLVDEDIPRQFITTSNVCIIANEWKTLSADVEAIEDRAVALFFKPSALEVHRQTTLWFDDQITFDFIGSILHLIEQPSMRHYLFARNLRKAGFKDWKHRVIERVCAGEILKMATIMEIEGLTAPQRTKEWVARKYGSRAQYFRVLKRMPKPVEVPKLKVKGKPMRKRKAKVETITEPVSQSQVPETKVPSETQLRVVS